MKKFLILSMLFILASCASIKLSDFDPGYKNKLLLPALEPKIDISSFEDAYLMYYIKNSNALYYTDSTTDLPYTIAPVPKDIRMKDAISIFKREVKENICSFSPEKKGTIVCHIPFAVSENSGNSFLLLSTFTFGILNLIGMPLFSYKTELELEVEIFTNSGKQIGSYRARGSNTAWVALYYGYSMQSANRISNAKAFKIAMNGIKQQIEMDAERLTNELH